MTDDGLHKSQKIGIERRLIEDAAAEPVACGNALSPLVVGAAVPGKMIKERDRLNLEKIEQAENERSGKDDNHPFEPILRCPSCRIDRRSLGPGFYALF